MDEIPAFVPPHEITDTYWSEWLGVEGQFVKWTFREDGLLVELPDGSQHSGNWLASENQITVRIPEEGRLVTYSGTYSADLLRPRKVLKLVTASIEAGAPAVVKQLSYDGRVYYSETGAYCREWHYYWRLLVPETGQAGTIQGEILRITNRLSAMYGNSGGGNWMECPETYDAYAHVAIVVLCDGTLDEAATAFARKTITNLQSYCHNDGSSITGPDYSDVDRLPDLAFEWCKLHPRLIPRQPDPRMEF